MLLTRYIGYIICIKICNKVVVMHLQFKFKTIKRIGVPPLPREGVHQWNNSVKETSFKTLRDEYESTFIILYQVSS